MALRKNHLYQPKHLPDCILLPFLGIKWKNSGQTVNKQWINNEQTADRHVTNGGQIVDKQWTHVNCEHTLDRQWPNSEQMWPNSDQTVDKQWTNSGQTVNKQ